MFTVALNLLFCSLAAYPLARLEFRGRELIFSLIVSTILIPFQIVMIPLYILAVQLGLRNTYLGLIFPAIASAFGIFLLRQAFQGVPKELEEAARMDGAKPVDLFRFVMLPHLSRAIAVVAMIETIFFLTIFAEIFVTTGGGPGLATTNLAYYIFLKALLEFDVGGASAGGLIAVILANIVAIFLMRSVARNIDT